MSGVRAVSHFHDRRAEGPVDIESGRRLSDATAEPAAEPSATRMSDAWPHGEERAEALRAKARVSNHEGVVRAASSFETAASRPPQDEAADFLSWLGLSRPSMSCLLYVRKKDVDARVKPAHDTITLQRSRRAHAAPARSCARAAAFGSAAMTSR